LVHVEVLLEDLVDLAPDGVVLGEDFLDVAGNEKKLDHLVDDVVDSFVAHLEAAHVRHLALDLVEARVVISAALESLPRRLVHPLLGSEVFLEDGRHVHLGIRDPHRLYLDIAFRHQRCDDVAGDGGDDFRVELHSFSILSILTCEGRPCRTCVRQGARKNSAMQHRLNYVVSASIGSGAGASSSSSASSSAAAASNATSSRSRSRAPSPGPACGGAPPPSPRTPAPPSPDSGASSPAACAARKRCTRSASWRLKPSPCAISSGLAARMRLS